jgi:hypothetical protein
MALEQLIRSSEALPSHDLVAERIRIVQNLHTFLTVAADKTRSSQERSLAWQSALSRACDDPVRAQAADQIFHRSLEAFREHGDAGSAKMLRHEQEQLYQFDFELGSMASEELIEQDAALVITDLYADRLQHEQLIELARVFVRQGKNEPDESYRVRRQSSIESLGKLPGLGGRETWGLRRNVEDVLDIYRYLREKGIDQSQWPRRQNGTLRESLIDHRAILRVAGRTLEDVHAAWNVPARIQLIRSEGVKSEQPNVLEHIQQSKVSARQPDLERDVVERYFVDDGERSKAYRLMRLRHLLRDQPQTEQIEFYGIAGSVADWLFAPQRSDINPDPAVTLLVESEANHATLLRSLPQEQRELLTRMTAQYLSGAALEISRERMPDADRHRRAKLVLRLMFILAPRRKAPPLRSGHES